MSIQIKFYTFILFFYGLAVFSQVKSENIDSLYNHISPLKDSPSKVESLLQLNRKAYYQRPDILEKALETAERIYYIDGIAKAYDQKGYVERRKNNFTKSVAYHKRALGFFDKSKDTVSKIKCLNNLGVALRKLNLEKESYGFYIQALDLAKKSNNDEQIARIYNGIGNVFVNTEEYDKALFYFNESLKLEKKKKKLKGQEYNMANIGEVYLYQKQYDSSEFYLKNALDIAKVIYKTDHLGVEYNLLGKLYLDKKDYIKSIYYFQKALPSLQKRNIKRYEANTLINMGLAELALHKNKQALKDINTGLQIAHNIKSKENISLGYDALVQFYEAKKDYQKALQAHKLAKKFHDSIVNINSKNGIISSQMIYETKEKDAKIIKLAEEKELAKKKSKKNFLMLLLVSFLGIVGMFIIYTFFNLRRKNRDLELEQKNSEIQNYILKINELKNSLNKPKKVIQDLTEKFDTFDLTNRERDVLQLISEGFSNDEIASKMYISKNTVKSHIKNIYTKLDVKSRIQVLKKLKNT